MTGRGRPTAAELRALARRDPALGRALARVTPYPGFPEGAANRAHSHFHALARAVVHQMLSGKAAATIHGRLLALSPGRRFMTAAELLALDEERLRGAGLSRAKAAALRDLAERVVDGRLPLARVARLPDDEVVERVTEVRGLGEWTAHMFLIFRLGRLDVMPGADLGVQEGLRRLDGLAERPRPREVLARAEVWRPLRSVAAWTLWRLVDEANDAPEPS